MANFERLMRIGGWLAIPALAIGSWTPAEEMVRTGMSGSLEHVIAYLITGFVFIKGYSERPNWQVASALSGYAAVLEAGQLFAPGRHAGFLEWAASAGGVLCAVFLANAWRIIKDSTFIGNAHHLKSNADLPLTIGTSR